MLKTLIAKGIITGIITGLTVTTFETCYFFTSQVYIPPDYPVSLLLFNTVFWAFTGLCAGCVIGIISRKQSNSLEYIRWFVCFIIPFALLYGLLGKFQSEKITSADWFSHLSLAWVALFLSYIFIGIRKKRSSPYRSSYFLPEIITVTALFTFCSNVMSFEFFRMLFEKITAYNSVSLFFSSIFPQSIPPFRKAMYVFKGYTVLLNFLLAVLIFTLYFIFTKSHPSLFRRKSLPTLSLLSFFCVIIIVTAIGQQYWFKKTHYPDLTSPVHLSGTSRNDKMPNVILIVLDTVRADRLSMYGPYKTSPNLRSFAREALIFDRCIASSSWTLPSHASLFTGLFPTEHGTNYDTEKPFLYPLNENFTTLADIFQESGYRTGAIISNWIVLHENLHFDKGFEIYNCARGTGSLHSLPFSPLLPLFSFLTNVKPKYRLIYMTAEDVNNNTRFFLNKYGRDPFFLCLNYMDAHAVYNPPRPYSHMFSTKKYPHLYNIANRIFNWDSNDHNLFLLSQYDGEIAYLDYHLGQLFSFLKKNNLYDNTLIVVTADHGELFNEHGISGHETVLYQGTVHVPLLIKFPQSVKTGRTNTLITLSDVFSTIISLAGLPEPDISSGIPMGSSRRAFASELLHHKYGEHRALYCGDYKLIHLPKQNTYELYNITANPQETNNLLDKNPDLANDMIKNLQHWIAAHQPKYDKSLKEKADISEDIKKGLKALGYIQ